MKSEKSSKSSKKSELFKTILALDIGTDFVRAVLAAPVETENGKKSRGGLTDGNMKILAFSKVRQLPGNMSRGAIANINGVIKTCEEAVSEIEKKSGRSAKNVVVGISGEHAKGEVTTIRYRRDSPNKTITSGELDELMSKIETRAEKKVKNEILMEMDSPDVELSLVNSALVSLSIDGYKINNPVGFRGAEVLIEYYTAFAPTISVSAIEKVCVELELELLAVAVNPFAVCRAILGDEIDADFSAVLVDIGGGTTDIGVIDAGEICGTKSLNLAGIDFTHQIANLLGVRPITAEKYKINLENEDILSDSVISKTMGASRQSLSIWLAGLSIALEDFRNVSRLPEDIFISGGSSKFIPLEEALATSDWFGDLCFEKRPVIHLIDIFNLPNFTFSENEEENMGLDEGFLTALGLVRVAVDTVLVSPESHGLKAKISRLLSH